MSFWNRIFGKQKAIATDAPPPPRAAATRTAAVPKPTQQVRQSDEINALVEALSNENVRISDETRSAAAIGLVKIGRPAVPDLLEILSHPWPKVRLLAARALADIADPATFDTFAALASNKGKDPDVRSAVILGLGNIGDQRALDLLIQIAEDYDVDYSDPMRAAIVALGCIGGQRARDVVQKTATGDSRYANQTASKVLKECFGIVTKQELETQMRIAASSGKAKEVAELLAAGADVNSRASDGRTALQDAAESGHEEVVQFLISKGADVNVPDQGEHTPLHRSSLQGKKGVVMRLLEAGADVNARSHEGVTPLYWAAEGGHKEIAEMLIAKGASINCSCNIGRTPLYMSVLRNQKDVATLLISKGAGVNDRALDKFTPLGRAIDSGFAELSAILRQHGAVS